MLNFILGKINYKYVALGLVIFSVLMSLLYQLEKTRHKATVSEFEAFKAKIASLGEIQKAKNKEIEARQELINKTIVNSYEETIKQIEAHYENNPNTKYIYINRMQDANSSSSRMSNTTDSTSTINSRLDGVEKDTAARDSEQIQIDLNKVSQEVVQCLELIKWNKTGINN
ncbi:MAG TPA: hypothetical protein VIC51_07700 [Psychromonas sp.]